MTPADLSAWITRHFGGWGGIARAAEYLCIHRTSVERKLRGDQPITQRDEQMCRALDNNRTQNA